MNNQPDITLVHFAALTGNPVPVTTMRLFIYKGRELPLHRIAEGCPCLMQKYTRLMGQTVYNFYKKRGLVA